MGEIPLLSEAGVEFSLPDTAPDRWRGRERHVLIFNYTFACPLSCDFCCYGCHPNRAEKMPLDLALRLVREAAESRLFSSIAFTGGEALLFLDEVLTVAAEARRLGIPFTVTTAAHWASTPAEADRVVGLMAERGLTRMNLSSDPSHEKFVPLQNVVNAARAANARDIDVIVTGVFHDSGEDVAARAPELAAMPSVLLLTRFVNKVGRAARDQIDQERYGLDLRLDDYACYRRRYHDLVVFYDGETFPCCSTFNRSTKGIRLGNANRASLQTLFNRAELSSMFRTMKREGFAKFYQIVARYDPELFAVLPAPEAAVGACHLCHLLFKDQRTAERLYVVFDRYADEEADEMVNLMVNLLGAEKATAVLGEMLVTP